MIDGTGCPPRPSWRWSVLVACDLLLIDASTIFLPYVASKYIPSAGLPRGLLNLKQNSRFSSHLRKSLLPKKICRCWAPPRRWKCQRRLFRAAPRLRRAASLSPPGPTESRGHGRPGRRRQRHRAKRNEEHVRPVRARLCSSPLPVKRRGQESKTTRSARPRGTRRASFFGRSTASPRRHHTTCTGAASRGIATTSDKVAPFFFPPFVERAIKSFGLMFSGSPIFPT